LKEHHPVAKMNFCNWFLQSVHDGEVDPVSIFSNVARFSLRGEVNFQNSGYWNAENPGLIRELPLHDEKIVSGVR
jgi:hypothetical protein